MKSLATLLFHPSIWRGDQLGIVRAASLPTRSLRSSHSYQVKDSRLHELLHRHSDFSFLQQPDDLLLRKALLLHVRFSSQKRTY
jgi:hypothetical protein